MITLPKLIGHRGVKDIFPENTLYSIEKAIEYNLSWIEVDVKISKDNIPFLLHDNLLNRTTNGKGLPCNFNYKQIKKLNAAKLYNSKIINIYPPTLEEVLSLCSKKNIGVNIELKPNQGYEKKNVDSIVKLFKKKKFKCEYYFSSFNLLSLKMIKDKLPNIYLGFLIDKFNKNIDFQNIINQCLNLNCFCIGLNNKIANKSIIKILKKNNFKITIYSEVNINLKEAKKLWNLGVDSVFIDNPLEYKKILKI